MGEFLAVAVEAEGVGQGEGHLAPGAMGSLDRRLPHLNVEGEAHDGPDPHPEQRTHTRAPIGDPAPADGPA